MHKSDYEYVIELTKRDGTVLGRIPVQVDWVPAVEWLQFDAIRKGRLPPVMSTGSSVIEPILHPKRGEPYIAGFRCTVFGGNGPTGRSDLSGPRAWGVIPASYFQELAKRASSSFVEKGQLESGEYFRYLALALPRQSEPAEAVSNSIRFVVEEVPQRLPLRVKPLADSLRGSMRFGRVNDDDVPVFFPRSVLDEALDLTGRAGAMETGGILIGHLYRDTVRPEISVEITAQIPARHTESELTRLTFTDLTWTDVQAAIDMRKDGEIFLGWWHCHNFLHETCKDCDWRKKSKCNVSAAFMSAEDCALHRTIFPRAYSIALVVSDSPCSGQTWELFGWRDGVIAARGFHIVEASPADTTAEPALHTGGKTDGTNAR